MTTDKVIEVLEGRLVLARDSLEKIKEFQKILPNSNEMRYEENIAETERIIEALTQAISDLKAYEELKKRVDVEKMKDIGIDLVEEYFPKGKCKERGQAIVLYARLLIKLVAYLRGE